MKHLLKLLCTFLAAGAAFSLSAAEPVKILKTVPLAGEPVAVAPAAEQRWRAPVLKSLHAPSEGKRVGLHIRAFAQSATRADAWTMLMQIKIDDTLLERFNELKQPRLINRSDLKNVVAGPNRKYSGTSWYNRYYRSWDVVYGSEFRPGVKFSRIFQEDVTDYLFDIDDLVRVGEPFTVTVANIADRNERLMQELKQSRRTLPLKIVTAEVVIFENPADRAARAKVIPPPAEEAIQAFHKRIPRMNEATPEAIRAELLELSRGAALFAECGKHVQTTNFMPGHLWIGYDSSRGQAEKFIPILDQARRAGVTVVRVPETWADSAGAGAFQTGSEAAEKDFRRLIELCHQRKMKIIVHVSPGLVRRNRQYRTEWEYSAKATVPGEDGRRGQVCPGSPEWRSFFFAEVRNLFDRYEIDGICVEPGINGAEETRCTQSNHVHAFRETGNPVFSTLDMLTRLATLCRRRGKLCYILADGLPNLSSICDGQYVGKDTPLMRTYFNRHSGYAGGVWFLPMTRSFTYYSMREVYGSVMVAGHFPAFLYDEQGDWKSEWQFYRCYLPLWAAMNRPGTHIYRQITATPLLKKIPSRLTLTAFVNSSTFLVVNNSGASSAECAFTRELTDLETGETAGTFRINERDFRIFLLPPAQSQDALPAQKPAQAAPQSDGRSPETPSAAPAGVPDMIPGKDADEAPKSLTTPRRYRKRR